MTRTADRLASSVHLSADLRHVAILDQSQLPNREITLELDTLDAMVRALQELQVRGAPAIGIFAAYCIYVLARANQHLPFPDFRARVESSAATLSAARPTAVNLAWACRRMCAVLRRADDERLTPPAATDALLHEAYAIHDEDIAMCERIAELGLSLLTPGSGILTHCNAGALATSKYGTALGPVLLGAERGIPFHVFVDETRPLLQGARLTAWELSRAGVSLSLICDNMAATVMAQGKVQAVLVGADRIAANGDFANKIGTLGVAVLAKHFGVPAYVLAPSSTVDFSCESGADIPVEQRRPDEIRRLWYAEPQAPANVPCYNPAFDVTPHELVTAIVTDRAIIRPPFAEGLQQALRG